MTTNELRKSESEADLDRKIAAYNTAIEVGDKEATSKAWGEVLRQQYHLIMLSHQLQSDL